MYLLTFVLAFLPRLAALGRYVTPDELNWVYRSLGFRRALLAADWANTIQSGHPGITTTWVGAVAAQLQLWLQPTAREHLGWIDGLYWLSPESADAYRHLYTFLEGGRLGIALLTSLGILLIFYLARPLFGFLPALLGTLLLALDPFYAGLSGLLHVDALLATLLLLGLLLVLRAAGETGRSFLVMAPLTGLVSGLAILTKTPGLILVGLVPLLLGLAWLWQGPERQPLTKLLVWLLLWAASLGATLLLLLPALWADPGYVLQMMTGLTGRLVEDAVRPTFFMGEQALDHGPIFYPVAVFFRLSPAVSLGVVAALLMLPGQLRGTDRERGHRVVFLLLSSLLFLLFISLVAKKFDRYALPALLPLLLVAGWGGAKLAWWLQGRGREALSKVLVGLLLALQAGYLVSALPYPLTAYNWLAGGKRAAAGVLPAGWGEEAGAAARFLADRLEAPEEKTLFSGSLSAVAPFFPGRVLRLQAEYLPLLQEEDYVLLTNPAQQRSDGFGLPEGSTPWQEIRRDGLPPALLYTNLEAADWGVASLEQQPAALTLGQGVELVEGGTHFFAWPRQTLIALEWRTRPGAPLSDTYRLQIQLEDGDGHTWVTKEVPLLNEAGQMPRYWVPGEQQTVYYLLPIPPDMAPGSYQLTARVFDGSGALQGVFNERGQFVGTSAALGPLAIRPPAEQPVLQIPHPLAEAPGTIGGLAGYGSLPEQIETGRYLALDLWWQAGAEETLPVYLSLGDRQLETTVVLEEPVAGQIYRIRPRWRIPADQPAGQYALAVQAGSAAPATLGQITVTAVERSFELPPEIEPLQVQLGNVARLQAVESTLTEDRLVLDVIWQAAEPDGIDYTAFVHLRNGQEAIVEQVDQLLLPPSSSWAPGQVVRARYEMPRPVAGDYTVALGLYDADNGLRLPVFTATGEPLGGDQYLVDITVP